MHIHTKRRKRRRANAIVRWGKSAVRKHTRRGGRTGRIKAKQTPSSKQDKRYYWRPNPAGPIAMNLGC